ncbi:MAG: radical SAM protein [Armatimonadetes bacterium]|nr:radical SAM protein [Armatimonadota bacterium]
MDLPRLPLDGNLDLTYRCNNDCRHCWLRLPPGSPQIAEELSFDDVKDVVEQARRMGCRTWAISGGEPMLRTDFAEVFDYITRISVGYSLNTNGTLITPEIARLLTRHGSKMVALYGATAEVHDHVTRTPGSFEATMRGLAYLREAGAGFTVQIVPMRDNYHQYLQMVELARSLSLHHRVGAAWLWLTACRSDRRNQEIARQRLDPAEVVALDPPDLAGGMRAGLDGGGTRVDVLSGGAVAFDDRLFSSCIAVRRDFHIDPYGGMSFCSFIKDPALRYDLRRGTFREAWDEFIPSLADVVRGGDEYRDHCGSCDLRGDCRWCAVYAYLEHGRYSAKVDYLCRVARETRRYREEWMKTHLRYYRVADITVQVSADFGFTDATFAPEIEEFRVDGPGVDTVSLALVSNMPLLSQLRLGEEVHREPPWVVYRSSGAWVYVGMSAEEGADEPHCLGIFSDDHSRGTVYRDAAFFGRGGLGSLTAFPSDDILLTRLLADRQGYYLDAWGYVVDGQGVLVVRSGETASDSRVIVRLGPDGLRMYGTWSHGRPTEVPATGVPLRSMLVLDDTGMGEPVPVNDENERLRAVLSRVIRPVAPDDRWAKGLEVACQMLSRGHSAA